MPALNHDQRRESINTHQRFGAWQEAKDRVAGFRGSLTWHAIRGEDHLIRSYYDSAGIRRQRSEGRRADTTEKQKSDWDRGRAKAQERLTNARRFMTRQAAVNRALKLGRVPDLTARILRAVDDVKLLGRGLRVVGTNAIYAYEAAAGEFVESELTTTVDVDLLFDSRHKLRLARVDGGLEPDLMTLLRRVDRSFEKALRPYQAINRDGFVVDLIKPLRNPPWTPDEDRVGSGSEDLSAVPIVGLPWHENAPALESVAIDERGVPLRMVASDPRVFAAHKLWLSERSDRNPMKRERDKAQAHAVASLVRRQLLHLPYEAGELRMLPREVFEAARPLFEGGPDEDDPFA